MGIFDQMLTSLVNMDFFQVLFPFLLALAIFYGIFVWSGIKERLGKGPSGLVALVLAFFVMYYAKSIPGLSNLITQMSGSTLAIAVVVLFIIIILGLFGMKIEDIRDKSKWLGLLVVLIVVYAIVVGVFGTNISFLSSFGIPWIGGADLWAIVLFIVIIAISWHYMSKEEAKPAEKKG